MRLTSLPEPGVLGLLAAALGTTMALPASVTGADYRTIYRGRTEDGRIWAVSVAETEDPEELGELEIQPDTLLIVYQDYPSFSSSEPAVIFAGTQSRLRYEQPERSTAGTSIAELIRAANVAGGRKLEAVCRDGTEAEVNGRWELTRLTSAWQDCAHHGGVDHVFYRSYKDTEAVIACICKDYRLVAGDGELCGARSQILARVRNRDY
jgi:hypothetical protein